MYFKLIRAVTFVTVLLPVLAHASDIKTSGFYLGGSTDINFSYAGGSLLKKYFDYNHATAIKKGIIPGYDITLMMGYTFFTKNKSSLSIETGAGNSMIDYKIGWLIKYSSNSVSYFKQRWNKAINWYLGLKYTYTNVSLTVAPVFLFKIKYQETSYAKSNGQYLGYSYKTTIKYGDYIFGMDNCSKLALHIKLAYRFKLSPYVELSPFVYFQPALLYSDTYDFGPFTNITFGKINSFGFGLSAIYTLKPKR